MDKKRGLGKGLAALIPEELKTGFDKGIRTTAEKNEERVINLKLEQIQPSRYQPRIDFNDEKLSELTSSIKEKGFLQPILVRKLDSGYELIAGERRLRAAKALNITEVPAIVKSVREEDALIFSIIENIQREELNPMEEAHAFQRMIDEFDYSQPVVAQAVGKNRSSIANILRLLKLPLEIQKLVSQGTLTMGHARALLSLTNSKDQIRLSKIVVKKGLSVREIENLVKRYLGQTKAKQRSIEQKSLELIATEEKLQHILGTKVRITPFKKRGKIIIDYYSNEDLNRITEVIAK